MARPYRSTPKLDVYATYLRVISNALLSQIRAYIGNPPRWPNDQDGPFILDHHEERPCAVAVFACVWVLCCHNRPLISTTYLVCQRIIHCSGSLSNDPCAPDNNPLLIDHYLDVFSSCVPCLTAHSCWELTTIIARGLGWPTHIGP